MLITLYLGAWFRLHELRCDLSLGVSAYQRAWAREPSAGEPLARLGWSAMLRASRPALPSVAFRSASRLRSLDVVFGSAGRWPALEGAWRDLCMLGEPLALVGVASAACVSGPSGSGAAGPQRGY